MSTEDAQERLESYCRRIAYDGPREPTLAALRAIVLGHATAIPFENVDVFLGRPIRLEVPGLYDKLVRRQRGGYCFEHNLLLLDVLRGIGFRAQGLAARVQWGRPPGTVGPRTHMLLHVELDEGPHIADVGFGGLTPTAPLALATGEQATQHENYRLVAFGAQFGLEARLAGKWSSLYRFSVEEQTAADYEVANWFTSTHPQSLFVNHLIASRPDTGRRHALFNNRLIIRRLDGTSERRHLQRAAEWEEALGRYFRIKLAEPGDAAALAARAEANGAHPSPFDGE